MAPPGRDLNRRPFSRRSLSWVLATLLATGGAWRELQGAETDALRTQLQALATQAGFAIEGLDRIGPESAGAAVGTPEERLKSLLRDYNYLIQGRPGALEKVLIVGRKASESHGSAGSAYVETLRLGAQHQVQASIAGPNAVAKTLPLIVDTGASTLVLPASLIPELGFAPDDLRDGMSRTANGTVPVKTGILRSVRVGAVTAHDVQASFIADDSLHGVKLLGMSFLQRFRVTIDDARNELTLLSK